MLDEVFYSVLARYQRRLGASSGKRFSKHVFGSSNVIATLEFPNCLQRFVSALPPKPHLSVDRIIDQHTFLPYFSPFLPEMRMNKLRRDMTGNNGKGIHFRTGLMASRIPIAQFLKFCPKCALEDDETFGECYWHRSHQAPGVAVCSIHHIQLLESQVRPRHTINRQSYVTLEEAIEGIPLSVIYCDDIHSLQLSKDTAWLLTTKIQPFHQIRDVYRKKLFELGQCSYSGRIISPHQLIDALRDHFPAGWFQDIACEYLATSDDWILNLVRNDKSAQHPLMHLIFMQFLGLSVDQLFSTVLPEPFGGPNWPCLNPTCKNYKALVVPKVKTIQSKYTHGRPIGEFSCQCGYTYRRTGPDSSPTDKYRLDKVRSYGEVWDQKLVQLWQQSNISVRQIGRILKADSMTVKKRAKKLGLPFPRGGPRISNLKHEPVKNIKQKASPSKYRKVWLRLIANHPAKGVQFLRQLNPGVYTWLYRYDKEWLTEHKPLQTVSIKNSHYQRVDWKKRDELLVILIRDRFLNVKESQSKPVRITTSYIGRTIGQVTLLQKHLNRLPQTARLLSELVESEEDYAARKVFWAFNMLNDRGNSPQKWQVIRLAGIARRLSETKVLRVLDSLNFPEKTKNA